MINSTQLQILPPRMLRGLLTIVLLLGAFAFLPFGDHVDSLAGPSKPVQSPPAEFDCRWTEMPITLDGKADEAAWKQAQVIDHFYLPWLGAKTRAAKTATKA